MKKTVTLALDAMGGDSGLPVVAEAARNALKRHSELHLILVGDQEQISQALGADHADPRLRVQHASQVVAMDESPASAMRLKKDSSMRVAINLVKNGEADACVSAGNTGALMATARFVLKTLPGIDRPAICTTLPAIGGHTHMLDLGANVDCSAEHLFQFGLMGAELARAVDSIEQPRVALLNIGSEDIKGNEQVKEAHVLLSDGDLNYIGFVEGDQITTDAADVIVCDGFTGNVALKTAEGVAHFVAHSLKREFSRNLLTKLSALAAMPVLASFRRRVDPRRYNGASLLGLGGIVVKSHGGADALAFENAINIARLEVNEDVTEHIRTHLAERLVKATA